MSSPISMLYQIKPEDINWPRCNKTESSRSETLLWKTTMPEPREPGEQPSAPLWRAKSPDDEAPIKPKSNTGIWVGIAATIFVIAMALGGWALWRRTHQ